MLFFVVGAKTDCQIKYFKRIICLFPDICLILRCPDADDPLEQMAVDALLDYLPKLTTAQCQLAFIGTLVPDARDMIFIGQARHLRAFHVLDLNPWPTVAGSYRIARVAAENGFRNFIVGADAEGVRSGVYAFLEQFGCSFHLYGDILPTKGAALAAITFDITKVPLFALRGMQLWNYWYVGRDSWSFEDFDLYLTQFPKLGLNFFDFPLYLYEPLFTDYRFENLLVEGHYLAGLNTELVRVGREAFNGRPRFVSPDVSDDLPQASRNQAAIALMRRVFARARTLGIRTCVDIEIASLLHSNPSLLDKLPAADRFDGGMMLAPSSLSGKKLLRTRLEALVAAYPDCDYYGLWQPEGVTMFDSAGSPHPEDVAFRAAHVQFVDRLSPDDLDYVHSLNMAHGMMQEIKPDAIIATGGWGAERIIAVADALLPTNMVRSTLGYYEPQLTLKKNRLSNYAKTAGRKWHITWGEVDQHMWVMQPKTRTTCKILDVLEGHGVEGAMLLHWRQLFSDLDISLFAKNCWGGGDRNTLVSEWIARKYGAPTIAPLQLAIDALEEFNLLVCDIDRIEQSIFWVGFDCGIGGVLFAHRYIGSGELLPEMWLNDGVRPNLTINRDAIEILKRALAHSSAAMEVAIGDGRARLNYFHNHIRLTLYLHESHLVVARAIMAIADAQVMGNEPAGLACALEILAETDPEAIVADFAKCLGEGGEPDKGELGLLLSLNVKFIGGIRRLEGRIRRALRHEPALLSPSADAKIFVACGALAAQRNYTMPHDGSMIWTVPRSAESDIIIAADGFALSAGDGIKVGRVNPDTGCWLQKDEIQFSVMAPAGFKGRLRLYIYYEPDFDSAFCMQEVFVNDQSLGIQKDYFCRGTYWDEGVWVETDIDVDDFAKVVNVCIKARGRLDARLSAIELVGCLAS
jgi:hypothetical protein